jgi:hypothetical protein
MAGQSATAHATPPAPPSSMTPTDPSGPAIAPVSCPHCGSMNAADNLFCESCGYDFTTGQVPEPVAASTVAAADPSGLEGTLLLVHRSDPYSFRVVQHRTVDRARHVVLHELRR